MSIGSIFFLFLRIGALTFGGGIVMLGFIQGELRSIGGFSEEEIADMTVLATALPGPVAVNLSYIIGKRMAGARGAFAAVTGTSIPPFLAVLLLSGVLMRYVDEPHVASFFLGVSCAVVVIIGEVVWNMACVSCRGGWRNIVALSVAAGLILIANVHPFLALVAAVTVRLIAGERASA